jgi:hypothetical protein
MVWLGWGQRRSLEENEPCRNSDRLLAISMQPIKALADDALYVEEQIPM